jgi:hypothetical protein
MLAAGRLSHMVKKQCACRAGRGHGTNHFRVLSDLRNRHMPDPALGVLISRILHSISKFLKSHCGWQPRSRYTPKMPQHDAEQTSQLILLAAEKHALEQHLVLANFLGGVFF